MRYFLNFLLLFGLYGSQAQTGHYFLSHYSPGDKRFDHASFDMAQDDNGVLYFATRSGILIHDGKNWELISCSGAVYAIELNQSGNIFWAGANGFGEVIKDSYGRFTCSLRSDATIKDIYQIVTIHDQVYFMNDNAVFIYDGVESIVTIAANSLARSFSALFEIRGKVYITSASGDTFRLNNSGFEKAAEFEPGLDIIFSTGLNDNYILGTGDSRLFRYLSTRELIEIKPKDDDYLRASVIINGVWVNQGFVALATLRGGVFFLDPNTGSVEQVINYDTGLPDNEVFSILTDKNNNVWASHDYGFTRISPFIPFRSYSHYDNLKGNLLCALSFNKDVYVGTSLGLFKLVREEVYEELNYYVDVPVRQTINAVDLKEAEADVEETDPKVTQAGKSTPEPEKKKRGFFRFLKRNRTKVETPSEPINGASTKKNDQPSINFKAQLQKEEYVTQRVKKTKRILRTAHFVYKKVNGIDAKVTDLTVIDNTLIVGGLGGVFEINGLEAKPILEEPIRMLVNAPDHSALVLTHSDKVLNLHKRNKNWSVAALLDNLQDQISYVVPGRSDELWLCAMDKVYHFDLKTNKVELIAFENPNYTPTVGIPQGDEIQFLNGNGFYQLDRARNSIFKLDSLKAPVTYFSSASGIWYLDNHTWKKLGEERPIKGINKLNYCGEIRFIASDYNSENVWIINEKNELFKFFVNNFSPPSEAFPLLIRKISQNDEALNINQTINIDQEGGPLFVELAQANFLEGSLIEFRYFLKGINEDWSDWSTRNDRINFSYLPPGTYTLNVQSKDVFGTIRELTPVQFKVRPLYWKTPWFYAMEFSVFALLVLLSFKLSVRYRFISRLLSLLTIILLIEFIQTVIGFTFFSNSGPVIDFLIQVAIALIILPVEGYLRNLMFKSMGSNSRLFELITELDRQQRNRK